MEAKKPKKKRIWLWILIGLVAFFVIVGSCGKSSNKKDTKASGKASETTSNETTSAQDESTEENQTVIKAGMYKVGSEIPAGEYLVTPSAGRAAYVEVCSDSTGTFESIIANANVETFIFLTVSDGQYLKIEDGICRPVEEVSAPIADPIDGVYDAGMYRVGVDIPAGEYKVTASDSRSAYIEVCSDSRGVFESIVSNANVDSSQYITVSDGQYLKVEHGTFVPVT